MAEGSEPIEVDAEVIEREVSPLSGAEKWLSEMGAKVSRELAPFHSYPVTNDSEYRQAKRERAQINSLVKEVDTERRSMTKALNDAVKKFKADTDDVTRPASEMASAYDSEIKAYESLVIATKKAHLKQAYEDAASDIAFSEDGSPLVSFDSIVEKYGMGSLGKKWLLMGTLEKAAMEQLEKALQLIARDEETIDSAVAEEDQEMVKAIYFQTLDIGTALSEAKRISDQRERVRQLEEERMAREAAWQPDPEPRPTPESDPQPVSEAAVPDYVFAGYGTEAQAKAFNEFCREAGIARFTCAKTNGRDYKLAVKE